MIYLSISIISIISITVFNILVPVWSTVAVMGMPLKDINKEIGARTDPESWGDLHAKVINSDNELITKKGYHSWGVGICASEIVDAIVRNTCACFTVSTFLKVYPVIGFI